MSTRFYDTVKAELVTDVGHDVGEGGGDVGDDLAGEGPDFAHGGKERQQAQTVGLSGTVVATRKLGERQARWVEI